jgi:4-amino-4-deoxy-L-arabinose transferase-like glycosyltransferase
MSNDRSARPMTKDEERIQLSSFVRPSSFVVLIVAAYLVIGTLYAVKTPAWQVPDEPAHYNYVRYIVEHRALPVLRAGDYDQKYIKQFATPENTPHLSIAPLRYESWQPPLYYVLATPIYFATNGSLLALRLFSVALGGLLIVVAFLIVRQIAPGSPPLALGAAAFVAFVPQHVAMMAGVDNDSLAELLLALIIWQTINLKSRHSPRVREISNLKWVALGVTLGLGLWTKSTVYIAAPLVAVAIWLAYRGQPASRKWTWLIRRGILVFGPALSLGSLWWIRNITVYGWPDFLVSIRHTAVVVGQPTFAEWIAQYGWGYFLQHFVVVTFQSFWGQFGWMGVPMPPRYYVALGALSLVALVGCIWYFSVKYLMSNTLESFSAPSLKFGSGYLIFWVILTALVYVYYNTTFVQHQGRYLFPALIPIGLIFTVGLRQWTTLLPRAWRAVALAAPFAALAALDLIALFRMIVPALMR